MCCPRDHPFRSGSSPASGRSILVTRFLGAWRRKSSDRPNGSSAKRCLLLEKSGSIGVVEVGVNENRVRQINRNELQ
ncbi:MAG: hypothetical protein BTM33_07610 [Synechococcus sp. Lanier]|nr:MAG: hypothetical protein BTM33_07610 [Synechococcus sp. Lanier]